MKRATTLLLLSSILVAGCAMSQPEAAADLNAAFNVAAAAEAVYAAHPGANPKTVAEMSQMLSAAQAALVSWTNSPTPGGQAGVNAAIAALIAYEASARTG
jgi:hypothetical protein